MDVILTAVEARLLGCLMEKETTTPEYYPLSRKALTAACNQKSNRSPVMALDESEVEETLEELRYKHLAVQVTIAGSRVPRSRHEVSTLGDLNRAEQAILAELILRGPQTPGELRNRASRMHPLSSVDEVMTAITSLKEWNDGAFVQLLPLEPGRREARYAHLLCGEFVPSDDEDTPATASAPTSPASVRLDALEQQAAALSEQLGQLSAQFDSFRKQFA